MIVYTGHSIFQWVYVCNERGPDNGRLMGMSPHCGPYRLPDHQQPLGADPHAFIRTHTPWLKPQEITGFGIDGDGVLSGTPARSIRDIDMTSVFGEYPANLKREKEIVPIKFPEQKSRTKQRFVLGLIGIVQSLGDPRNQMARKSVEIITADVTRLVDEYFREKP